MRLSYSFLKKLRRAVTWHGVPENRNYEHTTYTAESALDNYVLARVKANRLILDKKNYDEMVAAAAEDIAKAAEKELDKLLKDFK